MKSSKLVQVPEQQREEPKQVSLKVIKFSFYLIFFVKKAAKINSNEKYFAGSTTRRAEVNNIESLKY